MFGVEVPEFSRVPRRPPRAYCSGGFDSPRASRGTTLRQPLSRGESKDPSRRGALASGRTRRDSARALCPRPRWTLRPGSRYRSAASTAGGVAAGQAPAGGRHHLVDKGRSRVGEGGINLLGGLDLRAQLVRRPEVVVVQERDPAAPGGVDPGIAGRGNPQGRRMAHAPNPRILPRPALLRNRPGGAIVHHDHLHLDFLLCQGGRQGGLEQAPSIPGGDHDRDGGGCPPAGSGSRQSKRWLTPALSCCSNRR